ncbi:unnamed protein product [Pieris macdunnoughi]|uniref:Nuclease HARBI1 n=1 Tax=Pieris macdunnoughi TaxID=345717 RepID=A0A821XPB7_9NEOP|nr:unnamed protein product [Pieris macdunnoughi]
MIKIHRNRTRQFIEEKFNELLYESSGEFHNFCRMSFTDFEYLLDKISPLISKQQDTDFREAIPAKYRLAITLRFIASCDSYKSLHYLFKVSPQAISKIIPEVCKAINDVLRNEIKGSSEYEVSEDDGRYGADGELFGKGSEYDVWEVDGRIEIGEVFGNGTEYD